MDTSTTPMPTSVRLEVRGRVAHIVLADPARRNALTVTMLQALCAAIAGVEADREVDALVLSGEGPSFCSGFDLAACVDEPRAVEALLRGLAACLVGLRALDIPVVARVQGAALAGGCALLTPCDFVVVARDAQLGYPTHRIGISPAISAPTLLSRMGPAMRALLLSNEILYGELAHTQGLATHCVDAADLDREVDTLVARLLDKGPLAMRATKRWMRTIEERGAGDLGSSAPRNVALMSTVRDASVALASGEEFERMLQTFWSTRQRTP